MSQSRDSEHRGTVLLCSNQEIETIGRDYIQWDATSSVPLYMFPLYDPQNDTAAETADRVNGYQN